jgi:hypothetical protein
VTGIVKSNKSKTILTIFYPTDDDLMILDHFVTGLHSGEHFCEIMERELMNIAIIFPFYAIDDDGSISSPISFTAFISTSNTSDHCVSQSNDIALMINRDIGCPTAHMASRDLLLKANHHQEAHFGLSNILIIGLNTSFELLRPLEKNSIQYGLFNVSHDQLNRRRNNLPCLE